MGTMESLCQQAGFQVEKGYNFASTKMVDAFQNWDYEKSTRYFREVRHLLTPDRSNLTTRTFRNSTHFQEKLFGIVVIFAASSRVKWEFHVSSSLPLTTSAAKHGQRLAKRYLTKKQSSQKALFTYSHFISEDSGDYSAEEHSVDPEGDLASARAAVLRAKHPLA